MEQASACDGGFRPRPASVDTRHKGTYTDGMEVRPSPDKQARLEEIGTCVGKNTEQIVEEAVDRMLEHRELPTPPDKLLR